MEEERGLRAKIINHSMSEIAQEQKLPWNDFKLVSNLQSNISQVFGQVC